MTEENNDDHQVYLVLFTLAGAGLGLIAQAAFSKKGQKFNFPAAERFMNLIKADSMAGWWIN